MTHLMTPLMAAALVYLTLALSTYKRLQPVCQDRVLSGFWAVLWPLLWLVALSAGLTAWVLD